MIACAFDLNLRDWQQRSKSTWIEIVAAPTGYIIQLTGGREPNFIRKSIAPLIGSEVNLLRSVNAVIGGIDVALNMIGNFLTDNTIRS